MKQCFNALVTNSTDEQARQRWRFARRVARRGRVSINLRQSVLNSFLVFEEHQNIYAWAAWRGRFSRKSPERILRLKLGRFHDRRLAFDDRLVGGRALRYGALNIGGLGAVAYGEYCLVLKGHAVRRLRTVYLRDDSLRAYGREDEADPVDLKRLQAEIASHSERHLLATLKHSDQLLDVTERDWARMLCSESDYVEALMSDSFLPRDIREVRLDQRDLEHRFDQVFEEFRQQLDPAGRFLVDEFAMLWRLLDEHQIPLEAVDS